jgi:ABC-type multidrug transport system fused ATPase/permease subunit
LLKPDADKVGGPAIIYISNIAHGIDFPPEYQKDACILVSAARSDRCDASWVVALTRCLIERWFGSSAGFASIFVEGIAGMAAAIPGVGPTIDEADKWVHGELDGGRKSAITLRNHVHDRAINQLNPPGRNDYNLAAISFLGFLSANYGSEKLHTYLAEYDSSRIDQAAEVVYHHPLAVLEEEWLTRLGHKTRVGETFRTFIKQILPLLRPYKWKQIEILCYLVLAGAFNVVQPYSIKIVIDRLTKQVRTGPAASSSEATIVFIHVLAPFLLLLLGLYVLNGVVSLRRAYTVNWLNQNVLNTLQVEMYAHMQKLAHNFYLKAKIGDLMARLNDDLDNVQSALAQVTNKALYQAFTVVGSLTALLLLTRKSPLLAIPIICILPLFVINYAALRSRNKQASREQRRRVGQSMADVQQYLTAHAVIKAFRLEEKTIGDYRSRIKALQRSKLQLAILSALTDLSEDTATALAQLVIFGVGGFLVIRDGGRGLGVGDLAALLVLAKNIFSPIASLAGIGQTMQQATGAMERVSELFNEPITISDRPGAAPLPLLDNNIELENVTFRYGGDRAALSGVTLAIPAGTHVAIVGPSGSGKSSTLNLLMRFWDPEEGRIKFDGQDLREITLASLRDQIGLVFQETFIFDTTLRENIRIGRPSATDAEIVTAAKAARLDDFVETLPEGYDTIPGENGARMSVGQKQRVAIARAYLRNPRLLILDEATSALDTQTEAGVLETLKELVKGRTTISVTHRIAQAATADLIVVLDAGRVVEQGTHTSLMNAGGLYQKLYEESTIRTAA